MPKDHTYRFLQGKEHLMTHEIVRLAGLFIESGVRKIHITGGEPLLRKDVVDIVSELAQLPGLDDLALITNGSHLEQQARALKSAGLDRITVSLDALDEKIFASMTGNGVKVGEVCKGLRAAAVAGLHPIKINAVVKRRVNESEILPLAEYARAHGYTTRFIEYMDVGTKNGWRFSDVVSAQEIYDIIHDRYPLTPMKQHCFGEAAKRYRYQDRKGEIGIIASITKPFCCSCVRARLSADGRFHTCLFAPTGVNLRDLMRQGSSDDVILQVICDVWRGRTDRYSETRDVAGLSVPRLKKMEMNMLGG